MPLKQWWSDYKALLKPLPLEGIPDLVIFRPPAFLLVQVLRRFPVTPNQVSCSALVTGLMAAVCFALGTRGSFFSAGLLYALTVVLDCADGMLARLKNAQSPLGRVIDGLVDYTNGCAILLGLAIGLSRRNLGLPFDPWILTALGGGSMAVHCLIVDHFRNEFAVHALHKKVTVLDEIRAQEEWLRIAGERGAPPVMRLLARLSLAYHKTQARFTPKGHRFDAGKYYARHKFTLRAWTMIELTMHILALIISALLYDPRVFFVYSIIVANIWMVLMVPVQFLISKRIEIRAVGG